MSKTKASPNKSTDQGVLGASSATPEFNPFTAGLTFMQQFSDVLSKSGSEAAAQAVAGLGLPGLGEMSKIPGMPQWAMPTMDPAEVERRIGELKTVKFWLDQNATALQTTIQALEVQKLTLQTLMAMGKK